MLRRDFSAISRSSRPKFPDRDATLIGHGVVGHEGVHDVSIDVFSFSQVVPGGHG